ncbi:MAG: class I SAM-dependent methyltransferase [Proteobacteria bacterium]|nr:class I SAM-dependent methyltransferase [Pseudomonadota bacterium]
MTYKETAKAILKTAIRHTSFNPVHMGDYIRNLYFMKTIQKLPFNRFAYVLDAGCGDGHHALNMAKRFPSVRVTGLDVSAPTKAEIFPPNLFFASQNLLELFDYQQYDFIYSIDVLEHIPNNIIVMKNFYQALKRSGYLYLHMPDKSVEKRIFPERLFYDFDKWEKEEHIGERYILEEIEKQLKELGFEMMESGHTFGLLGQFVWEVDRITDDKMILKIILMPFLKTMAQVAVRLKAKEGDIFCLLKKP